VGDSLQLDPLFELSKDYIEGLSSLGNVYFELKTKTANVDHLLSIPDKGNCVIGFSLNPDSIAREEEVYAAPLAARLDAAEKAVEHGYNLSFHFDPIIYSDKWQELYFPVVERLNYFPASKVAWISLGTLRYPPKLKSHFEDRPFAYQEFVPCADGKHRYIQKIRSAMYRGMVERLAESCDAPVYLCMESAAVWKNVFGSMPGRLSSMADIFHRPGGID
jgi:spore photoproduct lyase